MATRFAGSRFLDERRRRRLATEADESSNTADQSFNRPTAVEPEERSSAPTTANSIELSIRKIIAPQLWKHWIIGLFALLLGGGILAGGYYEADAVLQFGPGFSRLFSFATGQLATGYSTLLLLLSGQLALLIWWVRSQSLQDFAGRYRAWAWIAAAWFIFAFAVSTNAHLAFNDTVFWIWKTVPLQWKATSWLVPANVLGVYLVWALHRDMRECRSSLPMLWLAALCYVASALLQFPIDLPYSETGADLIRFGTAMCGHLFLFQSMLLHARYVIYETPEPPELKSSEILGWLRHVRLPRVRFRLPVLKKNQASTEKMTDEQTQEKSRSKKSNLFQPKTSRAESADQQVATETKPTETQSDNSSEKISRHRKRKSDQTDREASDDEFCRNSFGKSDEQLDLKGLSKRERRKLRKQQREAQRAAG